MQTCVQSRTVVVVRARTASGSRREQAKALFRNAILQAAESVFSKEGFHLARIQDIAREADTGVGTVYNHFRDKEAVFEALLEERFATLVSTMTSLRDDGVPLDERLRSRVRCLLAHVVEHRAFSRILLDEGLLGDGATARSIRLCPSVQARVTRIGELFASLVHEGCAAGELRPQDPERLTRAFLALVRAAIVATVQAPRPSADDEAAFLVGLFFRGARAPAGKTKTPPPSPAASSPPRRPRRAPS